MDEAFLALLEKKDVSYITVKEICQTAGVNRSTFYLHYETIADLLTEAVEHVMEEFQSYMKLRGADFIPKIRSCPLEQLYLITPEYLTPYLSYIAQHRRLFGTMLENAGTLRLDRAYARAQEYVFAPILERFCVSEEDREYMMTFYISGLMAIISAWLRGGCQDSIAHVEAVIMRCVMGKGGEEGRK